METMVERGEQMVNDLIAKQVKQDIEQAAEYQAVRELQQQQDMERYCANLRDHLGADLYDTLDVNGVASAYAPYAQFTYHGHEFMIRWQSGEYTRGYVLSGPFGMRDDNASQSTLRETLLRFLARLPEAERIASENPHPEPVDESEIEYVPVPAYESVGAFLADSADGREVQVYYGRSDSEGYASSVIGFIIQCDGTWLLVRNRSGSGQWLIPVANVTSIVPGLKRA